VDHGDGFTAWYEGDGATVGVLTLNADDDYERGETLIKNGQPVCVPRLNGDFNPIERRRHHAQLIDRKREDV
jgi:hypothetical protein